MSDEKVYQERFNRIQKAIRLEPVERVPVVYMGAAFAPRYMGMSMAEFCADPEAALQVSLAAMDKLGGLDGVNFPSIGRITPALTSLWLSRVAVPGRDLPADSLWQVCEAEVMTTDDYDAIITQGWNPFLTDYLPRVIEPREFRESVEWTTANIPRIMRLYQEHQYVVVCDAPALVNHPFEYLCGGRSMSQFYLDLYRMPEQVQAAMDVILAEEIAKIRAASPAGGIRGAWLGGWRTASALLGPKLWNRFVWPYYVKLAEELIRVNITPIFHWDQDWTRDVGRLADLPAKKCILNPDGMTNLKTFKQMVGNRMAVMGDVPASLFAAGTPDDIRNYVRELVELFEGQGLILCPGCDVPINAKPENVEAFIAASHEFGSRG
ncbi:MAG: uroporphyrinogen-III decarboxylase [Chloroflexi bacterium]|nr:uroporphyrinogen-III decarboxylase [Chloroflexota bacterium]